ncbi:hypothetical protein FDF74_09215 [Clostridium niameyense]|uniref:YhfM-like domain-containing protein n=1 Tax=Clostridium niameyense TaxID=1622073 RepID=A0A6M0RAS9_9CLOT|nr:hypothetical protein [Clostridium niameyense]NEZ47371.1 hypothetical protein [Clostridium niameyense]
MKTKNKFNHKYIFIFLIFILSFSITGCESIDKVKVKFGLKNKDFEYIKENKIQKIVIQNTRDKGFRFVVTDKKAIGELYNILSTAKPASTKSKLEPDYIFEMDEGNNKVHKFNYIAGLDKKDAGNLYSNNRIYIVSKRIDNDIIKSFWTIRKPKDFEDVYYKSIIQVLKKYGVDKNNKNKVGINLKDDVDISKFILSTDLEEFKIDLTNNFKNVSIVTKDDRDYNIVLNIRTEGYKSTMYKAIVNIYNKNNRTEKKYYIMNEYKNGRWDIQILDKKSDNF